MLSIKKLKQKGALYLEFCLGKIFDWLAPLGDEAYLLTYYTCGISELSRGKLVGKN